MTGRGLMLLFLALMAGCGTVTEGDPEKAVTLCLPSGEGAVPLEAELAVTPEERQKGLSGRSELARRAGMLFVYPREQSPDNSFWMHRTRIPLTILFLDGEGVVRAIQTMEPCLEESGSECADYPAGVDHWMALEVNQGLARALGIKEGDAIARGGGRGQSTCGESRPLTPDNLPEAY